MRPRLTGLPHLADRLGGLPHLSCKHDQKKIRDYMERRVTSPFWGPPPLCKQALNFNGTVVLQLSTISPFRVLNTPLVGLWMSWIILPMWRFLNYHAEFSENTNCLEKDGIPETCQFFKRNVCLGRNACPWHGIHFFIKLASLGSHFLMSFNGLIQSFAF